MCERSLDRASILKSIEAERETLRRFGVRRIGLFGSFLHGNPRPDSDLDFLVSFEQPDFDLYMDTKFFLEDLFGRAVDLVSHEALKPALSHLRQQAAYASGF